MKLETDRIISDFLDRQENTITIIYHMPFPKDDIRTMVFRTITLEDGVRFKLDDGKLIVGWVKFFSTTEYSDLSAEYRIGITCDITSITDPGEGEFLNIKL